MTDPIDSSRRSLAGGYSCADRSAGDVAALLAALDAAEAECARLRADLRDAADARGEAAIARHVAERERDALRAIVAGRTTAPTEGEAAAHNVAGGWWVISRAGVCPPAAVDAFRGDGDVGAYAPTARGATWLPLDATGAPCAWPVVGAASRWVVQIEHGGRWQQVHGEGRPRDYATEAEAWDLAHWLYPDTEYIGALCRVVAVPVVDAGEAGRG